MAKRPVFVVCAEGVHLVDRVDVSFTWYAGHSSKQKHRSVRSLHEQTLLLKPNATILEVSRKSEQADGQQCSAFNLTVPSESPPNRALDFMPDRVQPHIRPSSPREAPIHSPFHEPDAYIFLECAYQGSKVFVHGGPFSDLYSATPRNARHDKRLKCSGPLTGFRYGDQSWPLTPLTAFYDWLYITALMHHPEIASRLLHYDAFTDIEFNPRRSVNCQAHASALYVSLHRRGLLNKAMASQEAFLAIVTTFDTQSPPFLGRS